MNQLVLFGIIDESLSYGQSITLKMISVVLLKYKINYALTFPQTIYRDKNTGT